MFILFIKNFNLSIVFLLLISSVIAIEFKDPKQIVGTFDASLFLKADPAKGLTLSHIVNQGGRFKYTWHLSKKVDKVSIKVSGFGSFFIDLNEGSKLFDSQGWTTKTLIYNFDKKISKVDLEVVFLPNQVAQIQEIKLNVPFHDFDKNYVYQKAKKIKNSTSVLQDTRFSKPFGVNLEAEYLFFELSIKQRRKLLIQLKRDGFNSVRLHKLFREYQKNRGNLLVDLEVFLTLCNSLNINVYLDILSYPIQEDDIDGWKQSIFMDQTLQSKMKDWIEKLSELSINHTPLFVWDKLNYVCLLNENSLFFEQSESSLNTFNQLLLKARMKKWISRTTLKKQLMKEFYYKYSNLLKKLGFQKQIFLSNYQLGGMDLEINKLLSKKVDRHLYLDYPIFYKGIIKVKNENPIDHLDKLKRHYLSISPSSGTYLSEFNLPWPNRFQHTLVPILLYLNKIRPLKGVWFYDYRLRTTNFHSGGLFGVQKFRSIIHQIPYWLNLHNDSYKIVYDDLSLMIQSKRYLSMTTSKFIKNTNHHFTVWKDCKLNKIDFFTLEKGSKDHFDSMGQIQSIAGGYATEAILPGSLINEFDKLLSCP